MADTKSKPPSPTWLCLNKSPVKSPVPSMIHHVWKKWAITIKFKREMFQWIEKENWMRDCKWMLHLSLPLCVNVCEKNWWGFNSIGNWNWVSKLMGAPSLDLPRKPEMMRENEGLMVSLLESMGWDEWELCELVHMGERENWSSLNARFKSQSHTFSQNWYHHLHEWSQSRPPWLWW